MGAGTALPLRSSLSCAVPTRSFESAWMCDCVGTAHERTCRFESTVPTPLPTLRVIVSLRRALRGLGPQRQVELMLHFAPLVAEEPLPQPLELQIDDRGGVER